MAPFNPGPDGSGWASGQRDGLGPIELEAAGRTLWLAQATQVEPQWAQPTSKGTRDQTGADEAARGKSAAADFSESAVTCGLS